MTPADSATTTVSFGSGSRLRPLHSEGSLLASAAIFRVPHRPGPRSTSPPRSGSISDGRAIDSRGFDESHQPD